MVTSRAKSIIRLETKVRQRSSAKAYKCVDDIFSDIADLAGARVALYFPGERAQVDVLIKSLFNVIGSPKEFPDGTMPAYEKRFSGYRATHYRVQLRESGLSDVQKRYAEARVEIQVASVLMHAWAEVEHDVLPKEKIQEFERIRRLRNNLVHGTGAVRLDDIREATAQIQGLVKHYRIRSSREQGSEPKGHIHD